MTYLQGILLLLILILVGIIILAIKIFGNKNSQDVVAFKEFVLENKNNSTLFLKELIREFGDLKGGVTEKLDEKFAHILKENRENEKQLLTNLEHFLNSLSQKVDQRLEKGFEKTNHTFHSIIERLAKIDEAQKNIDKLNTEVISLQRVLTDNKTRGIFGEVQLQSILEGVFGEGNTAMFEMQYHFTSNNTLVDAVVKTSKGLICIDAKFSLTHYQTLHNAKASHDQKQEAQKLFIQALKKQILDISSKYILPHETLEQAFLFLPAEAIFAEIHAYYTEILEFAHKHHVSLVSPTTLMAMLTIVANAIRSLETQKQAQVIQQELGKLSKDFERFEIRWNKFSKDFKAVGKDIEGIEVTNKKIIARFSGIERLELEE